MCDNAGWPSLSTSEPVVAFKLTFKLCRREAASEKGDPLRFRGSECWEGKEALQCAGQDFREVSYLWAAGFTWEKSAGIGTSSELLPL